MDTKEYKTKKVKCYNPIKEFVEFQELDMEGKTTIGSFGLWKVIPELFEIKNNFTKLTDEGWNYYEENGLKHFGKGWVHLKFITHEDIVQRITVNKKMLKQISNSIKQYEDLISE